MHRLCVSQNADRVLSIQNDAFILNEVTVVRGETFYILFMPPAFSSPSGFGYPKLCVSTSWERETDRQTETERQRETETETERQRQRDRERQRERGGREGERETDRQTETDRHRGRQTDRRKQRHRDLKHQSKFIRLFCEAGLI